MVVCALGAVSAGIFYWDHEFARAKGKLDNLDNQLIKKCVDDALGNCVCSNMFTMPSKG